MILKNNAIDIKILPYMRVFGMVFTLFLTFHLGKLFLEALDDVKAMYDLYVLLSVLLVPVVFWAIMLFDFCFTKYIYMIEINCNCVKIEYGNGYLSRTLVFHASEVIFFDIDTVLVDRWYFGRRFDRFSPVTTLNILLKNRKTFIIKDNFSGWDIRKLLCSAKREILSEQKFVVE